MLRICPILAGIKWAIEVEVVGGDLMEFLLQPLLRGDFMGVILQPLVGGDFMGVLLQPLSPLVGGDFMGVLLHPLSPAGLRSPPSNYLNFITMISLNFRS